MALQDYYSLTQQIYIAYFGRPADPAGLNNFAARLMDAGLPTSITGLAGAYGASAAAKALVDPFGSSAESTALYGAGTTQDFVMAIFRNALGRDAKLAGLTFWSAEIDSGRVTRAGAALQIMAGAFTNTTDTAQAIRDQMLINNRTKVASMFTDALDEIGEQIMYRGQDPAAQARALLRGVDATSDPAAFQPQIDALVQSISGIDPTVAGLRYKLTAGADDIVGGAGHDRAEGFLDANANRNTLSAGDKIDLGAGNDILSVLDPVGGAIDLSLVSVKNVETLRVLSAGSLANARADVSGFAGLLDASFNLAGPRHTITAGDSTDVKVVNQQGGVTVIGGRSIDVTAGLGADAPVVAVANSALARAHIKNGSSVTITDGSAGRSALTFVSLDHQGGAAVLTGDAIASVSIANSNQNVTVHNRTAGHAISFTLENVSGGVLTDAAAGTVEVIAARADSSGVTLSAAAATEVSIVAPFDLGLTLQAPSVKTLRVGLGGAALTVDAASLPAGVTIDASQFRGELAFAQMLAVDATYIGSHGSDTILVGASRNSIATGDGDDRVTLNIGAQQVDLGAGNDIAVLGNSNRISGGAGQDTFDLRGTTVISSTSYDTITDIAAGERILFVDGGNYGAGLAQVRLSGGATFADYVGAAAAGAGGQLAWFVFGGDTYVVNDVAPVNAYVNGVDQIVRLDGVLDLSTAAVSADAVLTLA